MSDFSSIYVNGVPVIPSTGEVITGNVYFASSTKGSADNGSGTDMSNPLESIDHCVGHCTANHGDVIFALPGHVETISAAGSLTCDVAGVRVVFLGEGASKATLKFTGTAGTVAVSAAGVKFYSPRLETGIDAVVDGIVVSAADFNMYDVEDYDASSKATTIMVLTTSAAARLKIDGYKYFASTAGTQKTDRIKTVGALDGVVLKNIDISGDFTGGYPINLTNAACTNLVMENIRINNTNSSPTAAIGLHANTTGFAKNVKARVASGTTYVSSVAKVQWGNDCEGFSTDGYGGDPIGTALASGVEGKLDIIDGYFDVPTADATTDTTMRDVIGKKNDAAVGAVTTTKSLMAYLKGVLNAVTVGTLSVQERVAVSATAVMVNGNTIFTVAGGPIEIEGLWSECVTDNDGTASTLQYSVTHATLGDVTISNASGSLASVGAGSHVTLQMTALSTAALLSTEGATIHATGPSKILMQPGAIKIVIGTGSTTGTWKHYLRYKPMAVGVTVT